MTGPWETRTQSVPDVNYTIERSTRLGDGGSGWESMYFGTALSNRESVVDTPPTNVSLRFYRASVTP